MFNTDDTAMYRLLLKLLRTRIEKLIFRRVYADIMELFGGNLTAFVEGRETMPDLTILLMRHLHWKGCRNWKEEQYRETSESVERRKDRSFNYTFFKHCKEIIFIPGQQ